MPQPHHAMLPPSKGAIFRPARDYPSDVSSAIEFLEQRLRRAQPIALLDDLLDLAPSHAPAVEPHPEPAARPDVGRQVEALGVEPRSVDVLTARRFHADRHDAVAVVVVEEIREHLAAHTVDR